MYSMSQINVDVTFDSKGLLDIIHKVLSWQEQGDAVVIRISERTWTPLKQHIK